MPRKSQVERHAQRYKTFLQLYPRHFRHRFEEPMLQTFVDMCHEQLEEGQGMAGLVLRVYLDTAKEIIKEQSKEVAMNTKTNRSKLVMGGLAGLLIVGIASVVILSGRNTANIPLFSTVAKAKEIAAKAKKEKCLTDNQQAIDAIKKDDIISKEVYEGKTIEYSSFETTAVAGFQDIPAGTYGDVAKNQYDGTTAKGSIAYEKDYGAYNYQMKKLSEPGQWELVSLTVCE